jgi:hypothetical protein
MEVPHYTYLVLKMPGLNRVITVKGSFKLSDICDKEFHKVTQTFGTISEYGGAKEGTERNTTSTTSRLLSDKAIENIPDAKKIQVHTEDPNNSTINKNGTPIA